MNFIVEFLSENFINCVWLAVLLVAMCPTLESKIAIPLAMNTTIWGSNAFSATSAFLLSCLGSLIPCYFMMLASRKIKNKATGFISSSFFNRYASKSMGIERQQSTLKKYLALAGLVAVPIPLTGVWTGSIIAGLSKLNINYCFISIAVGNIISAGAITFLCSVFENSISYIFMISLVIIIAFMFADLFISMIKKTKIYKK